MILVDYSTAILACIHVYNGPELKKGADPQDTAGIIKHMFFNRVLADLKKFKSTYGEMIFCIDGRNYWRKQKYPWYKGQRKHSREESDLNWDAIYKTMHEVEDDLRENFRYKILRVEDAEADDIIGVLCEWSQNNELVDGGMFDSGDPQPIVILAEDTDQFQNQKFKNVKQYSHMMKKFRGPDGNARHYLMEHIATGDSGDNIPSILTSSQWAIDKSNGDKPARQKPLKKDLKEELILKGREACLDDEMRANWDRNNELVNFEMIPIDLKNRIISEYINYEVKGSRTKIMNYLIKNKLKQLVQEVNSF